MPLPFRLSLSGALAAAACALLHAGAVAGLTFTVNNNLDAPDLHPGDGVCEAAPGICTLRAAVQEANAHVGADTI